MPSSAQHSPCLETPAGAQGYCGLATLGTGPSTEHRPVRGKCFIAGCRIELETNLCEGFTAPNRVFFLLKATSTFTFNWNYKINCPKNVRSMWRTGSPSSSWNEVPIWSWTLLHKFSCLLHLLSTSNFRFDLWASKSNANVLNLWFTGICKMTKAFDL